MQDKVVRGRSKVREGETGAVGSIWGEMQSKHAKQSTGATFPVSLDPKQIVWHDDWHMTRMRRVEMLFDVECALAGNGGWWQNGILRIERSGLAAPLSTGAVSRAESSSTGSNKLNG